MAISGSPTVGASTDLILKQIARRVVAQLPGARVRTTFVKLNELTFLPCQSCGEAPTPRYCFFDDLDAVYRELARCDCLLFGSPIYFDSVSAQAKSFMDRCNCFRPPDFNNSDPDHDFLKLLDRKRPGGMVLVGGEQGWFEGARRSIAGFFKWVEVDNEGVVMYRSRDFTRAGSVADNRVLLREADRLGEKIARKLRKIHGLK